MSTCGMNLIIIIILLLLILFGGGGFYIGGPVVGGGAALGTHLVNRASSFTWPADSAAKNNRPAKSAVVPQCAFLHDAKLLIHAAPASGVWREAHLSLTDFWLRSEPALMKTLCFLAVALLSIVVCQAQPPPMQPMRLLPPGFQQSTSTNAPVNYVIKVLMKDAKAKTAVRFRSRRLTVRLNWTQSSEKNPVKINNNDIPTTLKLNGRLTTIDEQKGVLKFFLGHGVPYVTSSLNNGAAAS